eukprot:1145431-Pelagomonas_calceolata.AAC.15
MPGQCAWCRQRHVRSSCTPHAQQSVCYHSYRVCKALGIQIHKLQPREWRKFDGTQREQRSAEIKCIKKKCSLHRVHRHVTVAIAQS